ncbi:unnamed protein product [Lactuca saligna]|uniref:Uncharacterized protein n=1 Tax=Lactuca saligna TaxID=75948 RepID=A0AA35Y866_LACSI|nr:unnamed protein product [Lactuca saligna]
MDILNYKFDKVILFYEETLEVLNKHAPTAEAYGNLTKIFNVSFQKVFDNFGELKEQVELSPKIGPSDTRVGKEPSSGWKWNNKFTPRDESLDEEANNKDIQVVTENHPPLEKIISEEEKLNG